MMRQIMYLMRQLMQIMRQIMQIMRHIMKFMRQYAISPNVSRYSGIGFHSNIWGEEKMAIETQKKYF